VTPRADLRVDDKTLSWVGLYGAIAQLVERVLCKHEVVGSIPSGSTTRTKPPNSKKSCVIIGKSSFRPGLAGGGISDIVN
jgi:hypothetical protein